MLRRNHLSMFCLSLLLIVVSVLLPASAQAQSYSYPSAIVFNGKQVRLVVIDRAGDSWIDGISYMYVKGANQNGDIVENAWWYDPIKSEATTSGWWWKDSVYLKFTVKIGPSKSIARSCNFIVSASGLSNVHTVKYSYPNGTCS